MQALLMSVVSSVIMFITFAFVVLIPCIMAVFAHKKGIYWLAAISAALSVIVGAVSGYLYGISLFLLLLPFTYVILYCIEQKIGFGRTVAISAAVLALFIIAVYLITEKLTSGALMSLLNQYIEGYAPTLLEQMKELGFEDVNINEIKVIMTEYIAMLAPTVLVLASVIMSLATYAVTASYLNNKESAKVPYRPLELWTVSQQVGCGTLIAFALVAVLWNMGLEFAERLMVLLVSLYMLECAVAGISTVYYLLIRKKMSKWLALTIVGIITALVTPVMMLIGFVDGLFKIRYVKMLKDGRIKPTRPKIKIDIESGFGGLDGFGRSDQEDENESNDDSDVNQSGFEDGNKDGNDNNNDDDKNNDENKF